MVEEDFAQIVYQAVMDKADGPFPLDDVVDEIERHVHEGHIPYDVLFRAWAQAAARNQYEKPRRAGEQFPPSTLGDLAAEIEQVARAHGLDTTDPDVIHAFARAIAAAEDDRRAALCADPDSLLTYDEETLTHGIWKLPAGRRVRLGAAGIAETYRHIAWSEQNTAEQLGALAEDLRDVAKVAPFEEAIQEIAQAEQYDEEVATRLAQALVYRALADQHAAQ